MDSPIWILQQFGSSSLSTQEEECKGLFEGLQTELEEVTEALAEVIARWLLTSALSLALLAPCSLQGGQSLHPILCFLFLSHCSFFLVPCSLLLAPCSPVITVLVLKAHDAHRPYLRTPRKTVIQIVQACRKKRKQFDRVANMRWNNKNHLWTDVAPWFYEWVGWDGWGLDWDWWGAV